MTEGRLGAAVALMSREPVAGRTKSRLAVEIGEEAAAALARAFVLDAAEAVRSAEAWHPVLFVEPPEAVPRMAALTGIEDARPQTAGHVGLRMASVAAELEAAGYGPIVIVGADVPTLGPARLHQALRALRRADVVFGEAEDGGYYLVGLWRARAALFDDPGIEWGGGEVLAATERLAHLAGLDTGRLPAEPDVDAAADLARLRSRLAELELAGQLLPRHTVAALDDLEGREG